MEETWGKDEWVKVANKNPSTLIPFMAYVCCFGINGISIVRAECFHFDCMSFIWLIFNWNRYFCFTLDEKFHWDDPELMLKLDVQLEIALFNQFIARLRNFHEPWIGWMKIYRCFRYESSWNSLGATECTAFFHRFTCETVIAPMAESVWIEKEKSKMSDWN